ncbi:hypothetical protein HBI28_223970 [Parastagonospora nodorum]|nr:hypothetical protein HBI28_223970 [Parastagonospora nodorum]
MVYSIAATTIRELGARHSLSNLSVHDLVEERRNYGLPCKLSDLYKAGTSSVIDTLIVTLIEDNDNLLNTINSHIKLRKLKEKHLEVCEADASKQVGANVREGGNKNRSSLYYSDSNSDTATEKMRIKARARLIKRQRLELEAQLRKVSEEEELAKTKKEKREKEAWEREAGLDGLLDSDDYCLDSSLDIDPEDDSEDEESLCESRDGNGTLHSRRDTFTLRTRRKCEMPKQKGLILRRRTSTSSYNDDWLGRAADAWKNEVVAMDPANSTLCDLSDLLVVRFCIFSDPALENIGILTNEEVVEMQTDTATALANELAAVNKLVRLQTFTLKILEHVETVHWIMAEANMPAVHLEATKHRLAPSAARFALVCGFRKLSFTRIFESITKDTNRKHGLCPERGSAVDKVTGKHTYKICNRRKARRIYSTI